MLVLEQVLRLVFSSRSPSEQVQLDVEIQVLWSTKQTITQLSMALPSRPADKPHLPPECMSMTTTRAVPGTACRSTELEVQHCSSWRILPVSSGSNRNELRFSVPRISKLTYVSESQSAQLAVTNGVVDSRSLVRTASLAACH